MDRESYLYMRARRAQKTACVEGKKNWDINYLVKIIDEWEKMQKLFNVKPLKNFLQKQLNDMRGW